MRYEPPLYRPPSEHDAWILQATIGCSWNKCTYCAMYRDKTYRERPLEELLDEIADARDALGPGVRKVFLADGDALHLPTEVLVPLVKALYDAFPRLKRVSTYATAMNVLAKSEDELTALRQAGLTRLYMGPESGDDRVLKQIAKGASHDDHVQAAHRARAAGMENSVILLLGIAQNEGSADHARRSAELVNAMAPDYLAALSLMVVPGTPMARQVERGRREVPDKPELLRELRDILAQTQLTHTVFRTNHASNHLPLAGTLGRDKDQLVHLLDQALAGRLATRPERWRGL